MDRAAVLRKIDKALAEAEQTRMWGQLEIEIRNGDVELIRKTSTERIEREKTHDHAYRQR